MPEVVTNVSTEPVTYACGTCGKSITKGCYCSKACAEAEVQYEGHDPDLDENGICRVCGKYEPE